MKLFSAWNAQDNQNWRNSQIIKYKTAYKTDYLHGKF